MGFEAESVVEKMDAYRMETDTMKRFERQVLVLQNVVKAELYSCLALSIAVRFN